MISLGPKFTKRNPPFISRRPNGRRNVYKYLFSRYGYISLKCLRHLSSDSVPIMNEMMMKSALCCLVYAEVVFHIYLWRASHSSYEPAIWGALMQILYYRLVSDFPKIEYRSRLFSCICGELLVFQTHNLSIYHSNFYRCAFVLQLEQ